MIDLFQYIGMAFVLGGQYLRITPSTLRKAFISTGIGSTLLLIYSALTIQLGFVILNIVSIVLAIKGFINWTKHFKKEKPNA